MTQLTKDDILRGLRAIDAHATQAGVLIDLSIYGGAALAIAFDMRVATRDVGAVVRGRPDFLRKVAAEVAEAQGWPSDWLNDGVKGFTSHNEEMSLMRDFEAAGGCGLRVHVPAPEYLFAMKCMAMRPEGIEGSHDVSDIEALALRVGIRDAAEALELVAAFYPADRIPPKVSSASRRSWRASRRDENANSRPTGECDVEARVAVHRDTQCGTKSASCGPRFA